MDFIIILIALIVSAFFSGMELAYIAANRLHIEIDRKQSSLFDKIMAIFLKHPGQYISTMLVGNNIALVVYSLFMSQVIVSYLVDNIAIETVISTVIIIIVAEFLPKGIVKAAPNKYLRIFALPAMMFFVIFYPITQLMSLLSMGLLFLLGVRTKANKDAEIPGIHDLQSLVDKTAESDTVTATENEMELQILQNVLEFPELKVRECMVPRVEVVAADIKTTPEELLKIFQESYYTRIPLYNDSIDNIIGYASSRDMFANPSDLESIKHDILYVPESGQIKKLLGDFIKQRKSMAVVIDEFGSTAGIITLEDILEEIVGEIEDEHDSDEEDITTIEKQLEENKFLFSARLEIDYLNEKYNLEIPESEEYETLAGFILYNSEELPLNGETIEINQLEIKILKATVNKISLIELTKK